MHIDEKHVRAPRHTGFTLIEVMVALMVFTFGILLFATSLPAAKQASRTNGQYIQASSLCQHKIDQLRGMGYGKLDYTNLKGLVIDRDKTSQPFSFTEIEQVASILPNATTKVWIETPSSQEVSSSALRAETKKVTVTIQWKKTTFENKPSEMSLTALIVKQ